MHYLRCSNTNDVNFNNTSSFTYLLNENGFISESDTNNVHS